MNNAEEFAKLAQTNEKLAEEEVRLALQKYGVSLHQIIQIVDGQPSIPQWVFKFRPESFLNKS